MKYKVVAGILISFYVLIACRGNYDTNEVMNFPVVDTIGLDSSILEVSVVAENLDVPWEIAWGPENSIFISEQSGTVSRLDLKTGEKQQLLKIDEVWRKRTTGLLGMVLHPDMAKHPYVFVDYTLRKGKDSAMFTKLVRYTLKDDTLTNAKVLLEIEGNTSHNGSRLAFSQAGKLLWATGDLQKKGYAQDSTSLFGKILSLEIDGAVPADNPIKGSYVVAWGFRNMQGLTVSKKGIVYTSEHGEAVEDEINLIEPLKNYGWPQIEGFHDQPAEIAIAANNQRTEPIKAWTPTVAPAGLDSYENSVIPEWNNSLLLATLKGKSLHVLKLSDDGRKVLSDKLFLQGKYGRLRDLCVSPEGDVYVATSNRDWNPSPGFPKEKDDRILRIRKVKTSKALADQLQVKAAAAPKELTGAVLYNQYCASCHKEDGLGVPGIFPPLKGAEQVVGSKDQLVNILLNGLSGPIVVKGQKYDQQMPAFAFLSDLQLALISTYIRSSWTNNTNAVSEADIKKLRK